MHSVDNFVKNILPIPLKIIKINNFFQEFLYNVGETNFYCENEVQNSCFHFKMTTTCVLELLVGRKALKCTVYLFYPNKSTGCTKIGLWCTKIGPRGCFLGDTGSGKGTVASKVVHISTNK